MANEFGDWAHRLAKDLWPIMRSITGPGVRETLDRLRAELPGLRVGSIPTGTKAFDWEIPDEWTFRGAFIEDPSGRKIIDAKNNNLHVLNYSEAVDRKIGLEDLQDHLYSIPEQPDAIPYVTSYYKRRWGFCLTDGQRKTLSKGYYRVFIDADHRPGALNYGELLLPGESSQEIFLSTYICHPSMANNELSGPVVTSALVRWLTDQPRRYSYRIVFLPETIGSIAYLSKNIDVMKSNVVAGYNVSCIGDDRAYSFLPSRNGNTLADVVARHVLRHIAPDYVSYSWLDRGSDERQYCAPGVDLPVASIMRSKYATYPEYHTSLDDLESVVTPSGLAGGFLALARAIQALEKNCIPRVTTLCEPQMGRRGLYPDLSFTGSADSTTAMMNALTYCDGTNSAVGVAELISLPFWETRKLLDRLHDVGLIEYL